MTASNDDPIQPHSSRLIEHVSQHGGDCGDPDCELHSPWVIETTSERAAAIAWYIAGAKSVISDLEEFAQGAFEEKMQNIQDEAAAPTYPHNFPPQTAAEKRRYDNN